MKTLAGLKVLDFSKTLAGPLCTQYLGDLGGQRTDEVLQELGVTAAEVEHLRRSKVVS